MLSNLAVASGAALVAHEAAPAYACATAAKRERFVAPMVAVRQGTSVSTIGDAGNGNVGTAAAAASRDRCG